MIETRSQNFTGLSRIEIPGGGQVTVSGSHAFVGHMEAPHGTSIIDVSDPRKPEVVAQVMLPDGFSHSHKVRVVGDLMVVNHEQAKRHFLRKAEGMVEFARDYRGRHGSDPSDAEVADYLGVKEGDLPELAAAVERGYHEGGFKIYDISDRTNPKLVNHTRTHGFGVHRFDLDENYLYMSTEMPGFIGNILMVYDLADPAKPREVGRWSMPEQDNSDGARPTWKNYHKRLHHALRFGNEMWAACWHAGFRVLDASDVGNIRTIGEYDYHPPGKAPTHTILPLAATRDGRRFAAVCDEEHSHRKGQLPAHVWFFDVTDLASIKPVATFHVSERDTPYEAGRFGAHQFQEIVRGDHLFTAWFSGGLRAIDASNPLEPLDAGFYLPAPTEGNAAPQSNDVFEDERGLVYLLDRHQGLDILEFNPR